MAKSYDEIVGLTAIEAKFLLEEIIPIYQEWARSGENGVRKIAARLRLGEWIAPFEPGERGAQVAEAHAQDFASLNVQAEELRLRLSREMEN